MPWKTPPGAGATVYIWNGYSLAERDRRWQAVRQNAARAGFDCVLVPLGNGIDARYMTQLRCSAMVLPADGRDPIVIADRRSSNAWVPDPWQTGRGWAEPMGEALLDLGMERARIGIAGLRGGIVTHCRSIDGVANHTALERVMSRLANARFEDATDVVGRVRFVKSDEEIEWLRRSAAVADAGWQELFKLARPGVDAGLLYSDVLRKLLELRSEYFPMILSVDGIDADEPKRHCNPPIGRRLEPDACIQSEIHAIRGAQLTQICRPIALGEIPDAWKPVIALQREVFEAGLAMMKPGTALGALADFVAGFGGASGLKTRLQLQGCGYGDDGPLFGPDAPESRCRELLMEKNTAFVWKPAASSADGRIRFAWGGPVLITDNGAEALFEAEPGMARIT